METPKLTMLEARCAAWRKVLASMPEKAKNRRARQALELFEKISDFPSTESDCAVVSGYFNFWSVGSSDSAKITHLRLAAGYTLKELAAKSDVGASTISLIENGRHIPQSGTLSRLSAAFGITLNELRLL